MNCCIAACTNSASRLGRTSGHNYDPILQGLDKWHVCDKHRCTHHTNRGHRSVSSTSNKKTCSFEICCRCNDIVAQEPVALHPHARKNRKPTSTLCTTHFEANEKKRQHESETRPTRKKTKVDESETTETTARARYLYLREPPPPKPQIKGMQYTVDTVSYNSGCRD
jgi:hypothetical protein